MGESQTEPGWFQVYRNTARAFLRHRSAGWWLRTGLVGLVCCALVASTWLVWDRASGTGSSTAPASVNSAAAATVSPGPSVTAARPSQTPARPLTRQEARYLRRAVAVVPALAAGGRDEAFRLAKDLCAQFHRGVPRSVRAAQVMRSYQVDRAEAIEVVEAACASFCPE